MLNDLYHALDPVAFSVGPFTVRWYGLAYLAAFLIGALVISKVSKRWKIPISADDILTVLLAVAIGVIVGARLAYILFYGDGYYFTHPLEIFVLSGMSFHGGLIGAIAGGAVAARYVRIPLFTLADLVAIAAPVGLFMGRIANFINGELWGAPTNLPWGVVFDGAGLMARHPSQLYEALLEGLVLFIVLFLLSRKVPAYPRGTFLGVFLTLYGVFRIAVEFVREPDVQLGYLFGDWLTMGMLLSIPLVIAGIIILVYARRKNLPQEGRRSETTQSMESGE